MTEQVEGMHTVTDAVELAEELAAGGFCALRWELITDNTDLNEQKLALTELCEERRTLIEFVDLARKNLTVVFNHHFPPPDRAVQDLVDGVEEQRWRDDHP